ncbi:unnamed protein product [Triticum turgidum subsp. durum]|uniref:Cysteine-rich receptor-like protein kinase n=1 Tax=Triticum turgidum subsp. durum TaxID=4567 RepID=A0A9R0VEF3_TRITD|nr:unnamed protein product [Triticum turgidum subsp. durum]
MATIGVVLLLLLLTPTPFLVAANFCDNVKAAAAALSKNVSSSPVNFATATFGQPPDIVYALALCRAGDVVDGSACGDCIANWFATVNQTECHKFRSSLGDCIVVYSDGDDILGPPSNATGGSGENTEPFEQWNITNVTTGDVPLIVGLTRKLLVRGLSVLRRPTHADCANAATGAGDQKQEHVVGNSRSCSSSFGSSISIIHLLLSSAQKPKKSGNDVMSLIFDATNATQGSRRDWNLKGDLVWQGKNSEFSLFDFHQLVEATNSFSEENKLGQGGFGAVYKGRTNRFLLQGKLPEGLEIAVKRLSSHSGQGFMEFKNEVQLIAKLQHTNLVRLLGCCPQEEENILVYEYLPNRSLDFFIFDENKRSLMVWSKHVAIIEGVAHGLLYLHKHSRLLVIHRDLKPSNILLDYEMNPKISDFGLAKILSSNDTEGNTTRRVVGTCGYMSPEYASKGIFSTKSDVFSFGVVILEILSGKQNSSYEHYGGFINLLGYAWQLWEDGKWADLVDAPLLPGSHSAKVMRCINIALLCVQENATDRPTMGDIVSMLSNETMILAEPKQPAYINVRVGNEEASTALEPCNNKDMPMSAKVPR